MLQVNNNFTESAHIADELMSIDELTRRILAVQRTVKRGVFSLDEALGAYEVSKECFQNFVSRNKKAPLTKDLLERKDQIIIGVFNYTSEAHNAISCLVSNGFSRDNIDLSSHGAETEGTTDYEDENHSSVGGFFSNLFGSSDETEKYIQVGRKGAIVTVHAKSAYEAETVAKILDNYGAVDLNERAEQYKSGNTIAQEIAQPTKTNEGDTIKIIEEKMEVGKREVETGGVRLRSLIVEQAVHEDVRLRTERVRVERTNVSRPATEADLAAFKDATLEMKETAEVPVVSKQAFVTGEVSLGKEVSEKNQTVEGTVRKTEVDTENFTDETGRTTIGRTTKGGFYK